MNSNKICPFCSKAGFTETNIQLHVEICLQKLHKLNTDHNEHVNNIQISDLNKVIPDKPVRTNSKHSLPGATKENFVNNSTIQNISLQNPLKRKSDVTQTPNNRTTELNNDGHKSKISKTLNYIISDEFHNLALFLKQNSHDSHINTDNIHELNKINIKVIIVFLCSIFINSYATLLAPFLKRGWIGYIIK